VYADFMGVTLLPPSLVSDQDDVWRPSTMASPAVAIATVPKTVTVTASSSKTTKAVPSIEKLNEFAQGPFRKSLEEYQQQAQRQAPSRNMETAQSSGSSAPPNSGAGSANEPPNSGSRSVSGRETGNALAIASAPKMTQTSESVSATLGGKEDKGSEAPPPHDPDTHMADA
jgi:hypothetical protein